MNRSERSVRARVAKEVLATRSDEMAEYKRNDDRIVELAGDRDEVGNEVERKRQIPREPEQHQLAAAWDSRLPCKSRHEDDAVGNECGESLSVLTAAERKQPDQERGVNGERDAERDQEPLPPGHVARLRDESTQPSTTRNVIDAGFADGRPNESTAQTLMHDVPVGSTRAVSWVPPTAALHVRRANRCALSAQAPETAPATYVSGSLFWMDRKAGTVTDGGRLNRTVNWWVMVVGATVSPVGGWIAA